MKSYLQLTPVNSEFFFNTKQYTRALNFFSINSLLLGSDQVNQGHRVCESV